MKSAEIQRLCRKYIMPQLPGFELKGRMLIATPIEHFLRAFTFMPSGFVKTAFYLEVFIQPLYEPKEYVAFTFGTRLMPGTVTPENESEVMQEALKRMLEQGLPFLEGIKQPADLIHYAQNNDVSDVYRQEAVAYAAILVGEHEKAAKMLDSLIAEMRTAMQKQPEITWYGEFVKRVERVLQALRRSPQEAIDLLYEWRQFTIESLKLERYAMPASILRSLSLPGN